MPTYKIVYHCVNCQDYVKQNIGDEGFVMPTIDFENLTDAVAHILESDFPTHTIETKVVEE